MMSSKIAGDHERHVQRSEGQRLLAARAKATRKGGHIVWVGG